MQVKLSYSPLPTDAPTKDVVHLFTLFLVRYKRMKGDQPMPKGVADLRTRWNVTKHHASPRCNPNNSDDEEQEDDEEEEDVNDEEGGGMDTTGLVFGHDKSEDESDD
jgi:hypothetical protein